MCGGLSLPATLDRGYRASMPVPPRSLCRVANALLLLAGRVLSNCNHAGSNVTARSKLWQRSGTQVTQISSDAVYAETATSKLC